LAQFFYRAFSGQGVITAGTIVADGRDSAIEALYGSGLTPFETREAVATEVGAFSGASSIPATTQTNPSRRFDGKRLGRQALTRFTIELSSLVGSGMPLDEAFRVIAASEPESQVGRVAAALLKDVLSGAQLSEAMRAYPQTFGADYCAIVAAGEGASAVGAALAQIAALLARRLELRSKILAALVYPAVLVTMSVASVGIIIAVLIPNLSPVFADAGLPLPGILATFSELEDHGAMLAGGLGLAVVAAMAALRAIVRNPASRRAWDRALCSIPLVGRLIVLREAAAFTRGLGTLVCARAPLMAALQTASSLIGNAELSARYAAATALVPQGNSLKHAFADTGLIPPGGLSLIAVGEETGQLGPLLVQVATNLEGEFQRRIERMVGLLTPLLTLAIGGAVGGLILQVMTAVLSINNLAFQ
jgi:general secretion pathway protein F